MNMPAVGNVKALKVLEDSHIASFLAPIGAILTCFLVLFFLVRPKVIETVSIRSMNDELVAKSQALVVKAELLSTLDTAVLDDQVRRAELVLPSDKAIFSLIRQIELAAGANGILLDGIDLVAVPAGQAQAPLPAGKVELAPKVQVKVTTSSNYASFLSFLRTLFSTSRIVGISDLNLLTETTGDTSTLKSIITIDAYWRALPEQLASIETPVEAVDAAELQILQRVVAVPEASAAAAPLPTGRSDLFSPF
ncbi:MAG: type 4a pilus biogenesis protein PilO [Candidatus Curtissbacteria bacterium]|nr:type 4a pilus biogenesis protein PilO [Candidatus Curtissbacteria bacterium]